MFLIKDTSMLTRLEFAIVLTRFLALYFVVDGQYKEPTG